MRCPRCAADLEDSARFCGVCGHRLAEPSGQAEEARPAGKRQGMPRSAPAASAPRRGAAADIDRFLGATLNQRFLIEEKLGEGGFGAVYRGTQVANGRKVAIKLLHPEMTSEPKVIARFRREGQVLCSLRDAHTVTTYDFDQTPEGILFIAMELLEGRSLHDVFREEPPIEWRRMLKIVTEMCSSLAEAHALGIVHRDLKPENIHLETRPGNPEFVKILDFGIAKVLRGESGTGMEPQLTASGQTLGTLEYMSPEQLMGRDLDGRSDVYGIGVLTFELITGRLPFPEAVGPAQLISAQLKKVPPPPSAVHPAGNIPREVDALVLKMLEKDRDRRFRDVGELRSACEHLLARPEHELGVVPAPPASSGPPAGAAARFPAPVAGAPSSPPGQVPGPQAWEQGRAGESGSAPWAAGPTFRGAPRSPGAAADDAGVSLATAQALRAATSRPLLWIGVGVGLGVLLSVAAVLYLLLR